MISFLIIEDDDSMARVIHAIIERGLANQLDGMNFVRVPSFAEGMEKLRNGVKFAVVFLDLILDDRRATEAHEMIAAIKVVSNASIIVLTGATPAGDLRQKCIYAGADDFWEKTHLHGGQAAFCGEIVNCIHRFYRRTKTIASAA